MNKSNEEQGKKSVPDIGGPLPANERRAALAMLAIAFAVAATPFIVEGKNPIQAAGEKINLSEIGYRSQIPGPSR